MGKRIRVQRRGSGSPTFKAATHKRVARVQYPPSSKKEREAFVEGKIIKILHDSGRGSPIAYIKLETGETYYSVVPEGVYADQQIQIGLHAALNLGNVLPLTKIPEGTMVCNVERSLGDGGKLARSSGSYATVVGHTPDGTLLRLPSGKTRYLSDYSRAMIGVISGAGRTEKPFLKAGAKSHLMHAKGRVYPRTRGIAMVAAAHPYGSSKRGGRKVTTVSRHAPPGKKVGLIAARSSGRKRKKR